MLKKLLAKSRTAVRLMELEINKAKARRWAGKGRSYAALSAMDEAVECAKRALAIYPDFNDAYFLMADSLMPGADYLGWLSRFHTERQPTGYVEIGVETGQSLALAGRDTTVVGIDPKPQVVKHIESRARLYAMTSSDFFASRNLPHELEEARLSLAFIDGLHVFEQVLEDFINLERWSDPSTVILIHDCLPITRVTASRAPTTSLWCGDVWKIIPCLKMYRPDLVIGVIPAKPSGLGIITNLDPTSTVLHDKFECLRAQYKEIELEYEFLDLRENHPNKMVPDLIPNDWEYVSTKFLAAPNGKSVQTT